VVTSALISHPRAVLGARIRERRLRPADPTGIRVLTYHGLVEAKRDPQLERNFHTVEQFRAHLAILRRLQVVRPDEVLDGAAAASRLTVAITFDDGYQNNEIAAELLDEAHLPWALFVSTAEVGRNSTIWTARLALLLLHGRAERVEILGRSWDLADRGRRMACFQEVRRPLKRLARLERVEVMDELEAQFETGESERLLAEHPAFRMLAWDEVRSIAGRGAVIGSHGADHEIHHEDQPDAVIEQELARSRATLAEQLGSECTTLAYPNGDCTEASARIAERLGYRVAFTTVEGTVHDQDRPLMLPRLAAPGTDVAFARTLLAGQSRS
jgi:peptidoglycan/xylan/chitin deacetylase (PgdA/CDA1 family)